MTSRENLDYDPEYDNWPIENREHENIRYIGTSGPEASVPGAHVFYDAESRALFVGSPDDEEETIVPDADAEWDLDPEEQVGEALDRLGEELQWESLSEFAEDHLLDEGSNE